MGVHSYTRALSSYGWDVVTKQLAQEVKVALSDKAFTVRCNGTNVDVDFVDTLTGGETTTLDTAVTDHQAVRNAITDYTNDITADFPDGKVNVDRFTSGINDSAIANTIERIDTTGGTDLGDGVYQGGTLTVWFTTALTAGDKTIYDGDISAPAGGLILAHQEASLVAQDFSESLVEQSSGSQSYQSVFQFTTKPLVAGTYLIHWSCQIKSSPNKTLRVQVKLDGTLIGKATERDTEYAPAGDFCEIALTEGTHPISFEVKNAGGNMTGYISDMRYRLERTGD